MLLYLSGGKYLVFFFYPLAFTFVCPTEILAFNDRIQEFRDIGAEVVGCSVDSHFASLAWMKTPRSEGGLGTLGAVAVGRMEGECQGSEGIGTAVPA